MSPSPMQLAVIALVVVLLFGAKKLPDAARSIGRSMKIFKAETKGLREEDGDPVADPADAETRHLPGTRTSGTPDAPAVPPTAAETRGGAP